MLPGLFVIASCVLLFFFVVSAIVAVQAYRRGYSLPLWLVAGMLGNPIFFLVLLAVMPDRARLALRRKELADLDKRLADRATKAVAATVPDARPRVAEPPVTPERSLGDQPTVLPPARSLGDDETQP